MNTLKLALLFAVTIGSGSAHAATAYILADSASSVNTSDVGMITGGGGGAVVQLTSQDSLCNTTWNVKATVKTRADGPGFTRLPLIYSSADLNPATKYTVSAGPYQNFGTDITCNVGSSNGYKIYQITY